MTALCSTTLAQSKCQAQAPDQTKLNTAHYKFSLRGPNATTDKLFQIAMIGPNRTDDPLRR